MCSFLLDDSDDGEEESEEGESVSVEDDGEEEEEEEEEEANEDDDGINAIVHLCCQRFRHNNQPTNFSQMRKKMKMQKLRMQFLREPLVIWEELAPMRILISVPSALTPSSTNLLQHQRTVNIIFVLTASLNGQRWVYPYVFF